MLLSKGGKVRKFLWKLLLLFPLVLNSKIIVLEETSEHVLLQFSIDDYSISQNGNYAFVHCENLSQPGEVGAPLLPMKMINIAVPPAGDIEVKVISKREEKLQLQRPIAPVPKIIEGKKTSDEIYEINSDLYGRQKEKDIVLCEKTDYRLHEFVPIEIHPFLYNFSRNELTILKEMIFQIDIKGNISFRGNIDDGFGDIYEKLILNYNTKITKLN